MYELLVYWIERNEPESRGWGQEGKLKRVWTDMTWPTEIPWHYYTQHELTMKLEARLVKMKAWAKSLTNNLLQIYTTILVYLAKKKE